MTVHLYARPFQPLTKYVDHVLVGMGFSVRKATRRNHPRKLFRCWICKRLRWAKNLTVQVYYDEMVISCREHHG